jgi:hypothetical protein
MRQAIIDWNMAQSNVTISEVMSSCAGQLGCVDVVEGSVSGDCAVGDIGVTNGGVITGSVLTFPTTAESWNDNFLRRLANHELGHHLGLGEKTTSCNSSKSLMAPTSCGAANGYPLTPPLTDSLPVSKTVYGGGTTVSCPTNP